MITRYYHGNSMEYMLDSIQDVLTTFPPDTTLEVTVQKTKNPKNKPVVNYTERFHGTNPDGSTFDMRHSVHGDWAVSIKLVNGDRITRYCDERESAIALLIEHKVINPEATG